MMKRLGGTIVGPLLILAVLTSAATLTASQTRESDRVDERASKMKVGRSVTVVLTDGTRLKGRIASISPETITIRPKDGVARTVPMDDVRAIDFGMPRWGKVLIGVGVAYGVAWLLFLASGGIDAI